MNRLRPRIAVVTHFYPSAAEPQRGMAVYHHVQALSSLADVEVFCVSPVYPKIRYLQPRSYPYKESAAACPSTSLPVRFVQYPVFPLISRPLNGFTCAARLTPEMRRMRPDIILASFVYPDGYAAVLAGRRLGIPVVAEALGSDLRRAKGFWVRRHVSQVMREASLVTTVSEDLRVRAIEFGAPPERVCVIRRGCHAQIFKVADRDTVRAELAINKDAELILFVGRLVEIKGLRELFDALPRLVASRPRVELACVGEGPLERELRIRAGRTGLIDRVKFLGSLEPQGIARWLAASNLLCLPSHSEGLPNVVIEALSCGRPVVGSEVGGIPEIIDPGCGILTPPKDPASLACALEACLSRAWDEDRIAARFKRGWEDAAKETHEACLRVLYERSHLTVGLVTPAAVWFD